jgi:hypothetical protein
MISMSNTRQMIWEKQLAFENEQFEKRQVVEKKIRKAETAFKRKELEVERIKAETLIFFYHFYFFHSLFIPFHFFFFVVFIFFYFPFLSFIFIIFVLFILLSAISQVKKVKIRYIFD